MRTAKRRVITCAHRGASSTHPENTRLAFDEAVRLGADMIEFDVRRTRDGAFVIMHDASVDRTTNGAGAVADLTLSEIRALDAGQGQRVPILEEAMTFGKSLMLNVHAYPETEEDALPMAKALVEQFHRFGLHENSFVTSWHELFLDEVHRLDPAVRRCNLHGEDDPDYVEIACRQFTPEVLQPSNRIVTADLIAAAHAPRRNIKVNPFFADDEAEMRRLIDCGVDGILTNCPARLLTLLKR